MTKLHQNEADCGGHGFSKAEWETRTGERGRHGRDGESGCQFAGGVESGRRLDVASDAKG